MNTYQHMPDLLYDQIHIQHLNLSKDLQEQWKAAKSLSTLCAYRYMMQRYEILNCAKNRMHKPQYPQTAYAVLTSGLDSIAAW